LNVTTSDQKRGVSDYFAPSSVSRESSGSGGVLGGLSLTVKGALISASSPLEADVPGTGAPGFASEESENPADAGDEGGKKQDKIAKNNDAAQPNMNKMLGESDKQYVDRLNQAAEKLGQPGKSVAERLEDFLRRLYEASPNYLRQKPDENRLNYQKRMDQAAQDLKLPGQKPGEALADFSQRVANAVSEMRKGQEEAQQFQQTAGEIRQAIQSIPELKELAKNLVIDTTPDGLRIQIIDQEQTVMFQAGSNQMSSQARDLMALLGRAIGKLPNKLSISGHTDGKPFARGGGRDNWDLSAERANASRRALVASGISESRIDNVVGRADRDLLVPSDPGSPKNRRIGIVLLREAKPPGGG